MERAEKMRATIWKNPWAGKIYCFSHGTVSWGFALNSSSFLTDLAAMDLWHIYLSRNSVNQGVLMVRVYLQHLRSLTIDISNLKSQNASTKGVVKFRWVLLWLTASSQALTFQDKPCDL